MNLVTILDEARRRGLATAMGLNPAQLDWAIARAHRLEVEVDSLFDLSKIPSEAFAMRHECKLMHVEHMPGVYEEVGIGPCCAHCQADLGVPGEYSAKEAWEHINA
jgi:hypothetical protein